MGRKLGIIAGTCWLALFAAGLYLYPGAKAVYFLFSVSFLGLLVSGFYRAAGYGYAFLAVFLWLGFWLKHAVHLALGNPYTEATGAFDWAPASWDTALAVAAAGALGTVAARLLYGYVLGKSTLRQHEPMGAAPAFYAGKRRLLWGAALGGLALLGILNSLLGIHQIGLTARTVLPFHLNGIIAWTLNIGGAMLLAVLIQWELADGGKIKWPLLGALAGAFISSVAILSRGTFVYLGVPALAAAWLNARGGVKVTARGAGLCAVAALLLAVALAVVSVSRHMLYEGATLRSVAPSAGSLLMQVRALAVDRWVGLEGLLSVASFPGKGGPLFMKALTEKRSASSVPFYEEVAGSYYRDRDTARVQFASIPGGPAFFYYTGSAWAVFLGMTALAGAVLLFELYAWAASANPFLCALAGMTAAVTAAQFGTAPGQMLPHFFMTAAALAGYWALRRLSGGKA